VNVNPWGRVVITTPARGAKPEQPNDLTVKGREGITKTSELELVPSGRRLSNQSGIQGVWQHSATQDRWKNPKTGRGRKLQSMGRVCLKSPRDGSKKRGNTRILHEANRPNYYGIALRHKVLKTHARNRSSNRAIASSQTGTKIILEPKKDSEEKRKTGLGLAEKWTQTHSYIPA